MIMNSRRPNPSQFPLWARHVGGLLRRQSPCPAFSNKPSFMDGFCFIPFVGLDASIHFSAS